MVEMLYVSSTVLLPLLRHLLCIPGRRLRNSGLIGMYGEKSSAAQATCTGDPGLQRKKTEAAGDEIGQTI
ncbi:unnamed protein product [Tetraodon nigroviridis]|uniref:(spotted green pufferfish) hypothetical protein n=1 Tax=Tetraodon nigroviridis TaxID=99883 RepID=Q4RC87_TETNG|nr:unnamed protein product [Tetraodon nigroviridis]